MVCQSHTFKKMWLNILKVIGQGVKIWGLVLIFIFGLFIVYYFFKSHYLSPSKIVSLSLRSSLKQQRQRQRDSLQQRRRWHSLLQWQHNGSPHSLSPASDSDHPQNYRRVISTESSSSILMKLLSFDLDRPNKQFIGYFVSTMLYWKTSISLLVFEP